MQVLERLGRLVRADAHGMMDALEERALVLRQQLREAEDAVARGRAELAALDEERARVREEGERLEQAVARLDHDVELAIADGEAELARFAIRRLLPHRAALEEAFARASRLEVRRERLATRLEGQSAELEALRPRVRAALARAEQPATTGSDAGAAAEGLAVSDEEVELELLRRRRAAAGEGA